MKVIAAIVLVASIAALSVSAAGAAPARTAKLTPVEEKWAKPVVTVWNVMNAGLNVVQKQILAKEALFVGTKDNLALNVTLANFVTCTVAVNKAGKPPSPRLGKIQTTMKTACTQLSEGALSIASGISAIRKNQGTKGSQLLQQGLKHLTSGSTQIKRARTQLIAIGTKNIFSA